MVTLDNTTLESLTIPDLREVLRQSSQPHGHLCPRQILGVRIGLLGARALDIPVPQRDKGLLVCVETDGCFVSGIAAATGCGVHRRTLRVEDYGKIAATFVKVSSAEAVRVAPRADVRERARLYATAQSKRYFAMLHGYQRMPDNELLTVTRVRLSRAIGDIISRAGVRVNCDRCGEEIINEREQQLDGQRLCRACAGDAYYQLV